MKRVLRENLCFEKMYVSLSMLLVAMLASVNTKTTEGFTVGRMSRALRSSVRRNFKVTLNGPDGSSDVIDCDGQTNILDAAEKQGINLPFDCRLGSCVACAGKMVEGTTDNSQQFFLTDELLEMGFILTCASFPTSDCTVETFSADEVNALY